MASDFTLKQNFILQMLKESTLQLFLKSKSKILSDQNLKKDYSSVDTIFNAYFIWKKQTKKNQPHKTKFLIAMRHGNQNQLKAWKTS